MVNEVEKLAQAADDAVMTIWVRKAMLRAIDAIGEANSEQIGMIAGNLAKTACFMGAHECNTTPSLMWGLLRKAIDDDMAEFE